MIFIEYTNFSFLLFSYTHTRAVSNDKTLQTFISLHP